MVLIKYNKMWGEREEDETGGWKADGQCWSAGGLTPVYTSLHNDSVIAPIHFQMYLDQKSEQLISVYYNPWFSKITINGKNNNINPFTAKYLNIYVVASAEYLNK